jgi:AcrR family transcriptional regulator
LGTEERRNKEKEIRKNDIIEAAERAFFKKGYSNATMDEVAKEAEFSKRTVYVYFNSKEQIYFEIMIRGYRLLISMLQADLKRETKDAIEELHQLLLTFYKFSNQNRDYFKAIMEYETVKLEAESGIESQSRDECYALGEQIFEYLIHALKRGVDEDTFRSDLDLTQTALVLWACTVGVLNTADIKEQYLKDYHKTDKEKFVSDAFDLIIRSIIR